LSTLAKRTLKNLHSNLKTKKMIQNKCSTLGDIKKILINLKKENNPDDSELIKFYENKINTETIKAMRKLEIQKMLCPNLY
jgi:hypothetical protein